MSRDPIGYLGSEWNLYEYVGSQSIGLVDPLGTTTIAQALRLCASRPTHYQKMQCICGILPDSKCCAQLKDANKHLDKIRKAMQQLKSLLKKINKQKSKKLKDAIRKQIDDLACGKKGVKGHCKECVQRFGKKGDPYSDRFKDELKDLVKGDKQLKGYLDKLLKKCNK